MKLNSCSRVTIWGNPSYRLIDFPFEIRTLHCKDTHSILVSNSSQQSAAVS